MEGAKGILVSLSNFILFGKLPVVLLNNLVKTSGVESCNGGVPVVQIASSKGSSLRQGAEARDKCSKHRDVSIELGLFSSKVCCDTNASRKISIDLNESLLLGVQAIA